eukprot:gnl/TRDRNA2_/TRDRNA2_91135_c0_seq1.p1 gnl/TRDRNA2_/TRDRNA2_91135_c0~~gnl/TRDRNA2_/TRDRNA2_91135_c0_seq1.p1  ORF type:complete len:279 (+),score=53.60 gnl/TRDRNA2_/TRDRNA2_91135_c0_seq1:78-914(+)
MAAVSAHKQHTVDVIDGQKWATPVVPSLMKADDLVNWDEDPEKEGKLMALLPAGQEKKYTTARGIKDGTSEEAVKSLRIRNDPRYKEISYYERNQATGQNAHLSRMSVAGSSSSTYKPGQPIVVQPGAESVVFSDPNPHMQSHSADELAGRLQWQEGFDYSVRRLMIDFDLTQVPECRLHHLDRFAQWFDHHGAKQARKEKKPPAYITSDPRSGKMPPGSTQNIPGKMSSTSLILAASYSMRHSGTMEKQLAANLTPRETSGSSSSSSAPPKQPMSAR